MSRRVIGFYRDKQKRVRPITERKGSRSRYYSQTAEPSWKETSLTDIKSIARKPTINIDKRYKHAIVEVYDNPNDDSPQVLEFVGDTMVSSTYQTTGKELFDNYAHIESDIEEEDGKKILVIRAFREFDE